MNKYQSERHSFTRNLLPEDPPSLYKTESEREFQQWKQRKDQLSRYDEKFNNIGNIQRIERFAKVHPIVYEEGIKKVLKEIEVFNKSSDPHRNKLVSLLWEAITVRNRVVPGKTPYLVIVIRELMNTQDDIASREKRMLDCILFICHQENIVVPPMMGLKSLTSSLVKQMEMVCPKAKDGAFKKQNSSSSMRSNSPGIRIQVSSRTPTPSRSRSPSPILRPPNSFLKKPKPPLQQKPIPSPTKYKTLTPVKNSYSTLAKKSPLFQLEIKINNTMSRIEIYPNEDANAVVERLRSKMRMSVLTLHEVKEMIEEFIAEHY